MLTEIYNNGFRMLKYKPGQRCGQTKHGPAFYDTTVRINKQTQPEFYSTLVDTEAAQNKKRKAQWIQEEAIDTSVPIRTRFQKHQTIQHDTTKPITITSGKDVTICEGCETTYADEINIGHIDDSKVAQVKITRKSLQLLQAWKQRRLAMGHGGPQNV